MTATRTTTERGGGGWWVGSSVCVAVALVGVELAWLRLGAPLAAAVPGAAEWRLAVDGACFAVAAWLARIAAWRFAPPPQLPAEEPRVLAMERFDRLTANGGPVLAASTRWALAFFAVLLPIALARAALEGGLQGDGEGGFLCSSAPLDAPASGALEGAARVLEGVLLIDAASLPLLAACLALRGWRERRAAGTRPVAPSSTGPSRTAPWALCGLYLITCARQPDPEGSASEGARPATAAARQAAQDPGCRAGAYARVYEVSAIPVRITLNRFGDQDPHGFMYVLDDGIAAVRAQEALPLPDRVSTGLRRDAIQPLVLRANLGDCLVLRFTNRLASGRASLHVHGLPYLADHPGGAVGQNADTFAAPGETRTYTLPIPSDETAERAYFIHDHGASRQRVAHGLFGALIVEPAGSVYRDPDTGAPLTGSNWEAIIDVPAGKPDFREIALLYHEIGDEAFEDILNANGAQLPTVDPLSGAYRPSSRGINYRSEPFMNRLELNEDESQAYGSYMFGDPATPIPRSYLGEPTKMRVLHAGSETFHVHHLHGGGNRWRRNPKAEGSDFDAGLRKIPVQYASSIRLDSQSLGPATTFNTEHECGAGGCQQAAGDFLFHCHIQHHYLAGMWGFWRVFDTHQSDLAVLPDRAPPPAAVDSTGLVGRTVEGKVLLPAAQVTDPATQRSLEEFVSAQLPPPGVRFDDQDATVWDWQRQDTPAGPLFLGEPETARAWANYRSATPGQRPVLRFNPSNGRYAWPLLRPHLGKRPPFSGNGHTGSPWLGEEGSALRPDGLCPDGQLVPDPRRTRWIYPVSAIAAPLRITRSLVDPNGQLFVLNEDRAAVLSGLKPQEPLVLRANTADCVDVLFTNDVPDARTLVPDGRSKANMHIHFVQFDPQGSDGVVAGFAYEQSVRPFRAEGRTLLHATSAGATQLSLTRVSGLRPGIWLGIGLGEGMCPSPGGGPARACTEVRQISAIAGQVVTLASPLDLPHAAGQSAGVEFVRYGWFPDVDDGTVFWHDHISPGGWMHGLFGALIIEPEGSTYRDPTTGAELRSGAVADIHAPANASVGIGQRGSFRELFIGMSDEGGGGNLVPGLAKGTLNLRAEPFVGRDSSPGLVFSSVRNGDPHTLVARAYLGDDFVIRALNAGTIGSGLRITGHRFHLERQLLQSPQFDTAPLGISERLELVLQGGAGGTGGKPGDYLFHSTIGAQWVGGAWGLLRVHDTLQANLRPLPDRPPPPPPSPTATGFPQQSFTGGLPQPATEPGQPCPPGAPVRRYDVQIQEADILYGPGGKDSNGLVYSTRRPGKALKEVTEPHVLRVNEGECLEVTLWNRTARRAGFHVSELPFDPQGSYGAAVGFNRDSSVPPDQTRTFRFFADSEQGASMFLNLADPRTGARGAFGGLVVEPAGSVYRRADNTAPLVTGLAATIQTPTGSFKELVLLIGDEDPRIGANIMPYHADVRGFAGLSYSAEPLSRRGSGADPSTVFSSAKYGDPRLVLRATAGDAVRLRVAQPWGEQLHAFALEGHRWSLSPMTPGAERPSAINLFPGVATDVHLIDGAGGGLNGYGDYLFYDTRLPFLEAGLWGLLRVGAAPQPAPAPARRHREPKR